MPWWQFLAIAGLCFSVIALAPRVRFAIRLAKAVWLDRIPEEVLFPGAIFLLGNRRVMRPIQKYLLVFRLVLFGSIMLLYASLGCPGRIGFDLTPAVVGPWLALLSPALFVLLFARGGFISLHNALVTSDYLADHLGGITMLRASTRAHIDEAKNLYQRAHDLVGKKQYRAAIPILHQCIKLSPDFVAAHKEIAHALRKCGNADDALKHRQTVKRLDPSDTVNRWNIADTLGELGREDEALREAKELLRIDPTNARFQQLVKVLKSRTKPGA